MPNHVYNEVRLHGVPMDRAKQLIAAPDGKISFRYLLPLPLHFWPGSVGQDHEKAFPGTHLDAARKTWGTKWDCYGDPTAEQDGEDTVIRFRTAWSPPRGWIVALFNTLDCQITSLWFSEGGENARRETYRPYSQDDKWNTPDWKVEMIPPGNDEHRRLHKALWGVEYFPADED